MEQERMIRRLHPLVLGFGLAVIPGLAAADAFSDAMEAYRAGDPGRAAVLFHDLAKEGDGTAQFNLALLYRVGQGQPRNDREALYWAWRARLTGVPEARALIALVAQDVPVDQRQPLVSRLLADLKAGVQAGDKRALLGAAAVQLELADPPNAKEAYFWQALAATLGVPGAGALRDQTVLTVPESERPGLQDEMMKRFKAWCQANPAPPDACSAAS